jgi:hypothetical protein
LKECITKQQCSERTIDKFDGVIFSARVAQLAGIGYLAIVSLYYFLKLVVYIRKKRSQEGIVGSSETGALFLREEGSLVSSLINNEEPISMGEGSGAFCESVAILESEGIDCAICLDEVEEHQEIKLDC